MTPGFQQLLNMTYGVIAGIFAYHAFQVFRLSRTGLSVPYTGLASMSLVSALYYLFFDVYHLIESPTLLRANAHFIWLCGTWMLFFHLSALEAFLQVRKRWLSAFKAVIFTQAVIALSSLLGLVLFDRMFLFDTAPTVPPFTAMPARANAVMSPSGLAKSFAITLILMEVVSFSYFLFLLAKKKGDRLLAFGLVLSLAAVLNDLLLSMKLFGIGLPLLFVANLVEILRLTMLIERANREQLMRVEDSLRLAQIGELTATLAHELNSPLTAVMANSQLGTRALEQSEPSAPQLKKFFENITAATKRMTDIAGSLRRHAHSPQTQALLFPPCTAIRETVNMLTVPYRSEQVELHCDIPEGLPSVHGDPGKFQQVLVNLLQNAKDATEGKPERIIRISADHSGSSVRIRVADNGSGIPPELVKKIFQPFFTTKPRGKGTGIGLSFVENQIKAMGGKVAVKSQQGQGTEFELALSVAPPIKE